MAAHEVIALFGPTGIGKTDIAVALARRLRAVGEDPVAVSADALQVYTGLEVLTGAADAGRRTELEHRLLSFVAVDEPFSAGRYAQLAHAEIDGLLAGGRRPIVVGGTGLYLRAALTELSLHPPPAPGARERWARELRDRGPEALHTELARRVPWAADAIAPTDRQRIVRALELSDAGSLRAPEPGEPPASSELWTASTRRPTLLIGLTMDRAQLYRRIDERVDAMVAAGAVEEVRRAQAVRGGPSPTVAKALGFRELLAGDVETMKRRTRQYARRQLTWMRKLGGIVVIDVTGRDVDAIAQEVARMWAAARDEDVHTPPPD